MSFNNIHAQSLQNQNFMMDQGPNSVNFDGMDCDTDLKQEQLNMYKHAQQNHPYSTPFNSFQYANESNSQYQNIAHQYSPQMNLNNFPYNGSVSDELSPSQHNYAPVISPGTSSTSASENDPYSKNVPQFPVKQTRVPRAKSKRQILDEEDAILIARDDSELTEEELQLKKKAQNRAAQRAFRERKETKLKELEAKLLESEIERQKLAEQLDSIRKRNLSMENEMIQNRTGSVDESKFSFPKTEDDFIQGLVGGTEHQIDDSTIYKVYDSPEHPGNKILAIGAVWDYLQIKVEELDLDYTGVNIAEIMLKLRGHEKCHGFGPAYPLALVDKVLAESLQEQDY